MKLTTLKDFKNNLNKEVYVVTDTSTNRTGFHHFTTLEEAIKYKEVRSNKEPNKTWVLFKAYIREVNGYISREYIKTIR